MNILGFHKELKRWINIAPASDSFTKEENLASAHYYLRTRYFGDHPYTHLVYTDIEAEDLLCYEVEF